MKKVSSRSEDEPSKASLREMPEVDWTEVEPRPNPYARRIAAEGFSIQVQPGRPRKGAASGPTIPRSVRFPASVWAHLERRAAQEGLPLHAALRAAVLAWLRGQKTRPRRHRQSAASHPGPRNP
jgi:hypothetical protein